MEEEQKKNVEHFKIAPKCAIGNLMLQAAKEMRHPGITIGFTVANEYLRRIAERSIELKDEKLLYLCEQLCLIEKK